MLKHLTEGHVDVSVPDVWNGYEIGGDYLPGVLLPSSLIHSCQIRHP